MSLIHSAIDAALLESACLSRQLASRYRHALENLISDGRLKTTLTRRARALEGQCEELDSLAADRDLLPREAKTELNDLKTLADQVTGWLDSKQALPLLRRFIDEERNLLQELDKTIEDERLADRVSAMQEAARDHIREIDPDQG